MTGSPCFDISFSKGKAKLVELNVDHSVSPLSLQSRRPGVTVIAGALQHRQYATFKRSSKLTEINKTCHIKNSNDGKVRNIFTSASVQKDESNTTGHDLLSLHPRDFIAFMKSKKIRRCFIVKSPDNKALICSHPELESFGQFFESNTNDYRGHEAVFLELGKRTGCLFGGFIWRTMRGQAVG